MGNVYLTHTRLDVAYTTSSRRYWGFMRICNHFWTLIIITSLVSCNSISQPGDLSQLNSPRTPTTGVQLLTDATIRFKSDSTVTYQLSVYSGGTATCESVTIRVEWPKELRDYVKQEENLLEGVPIQAGERAQFDGETTFDIMRIDPQDLQQHMPNTRMFIQCIQPSGYERQIIPYVEPRPSR